MSLATLDRAFISALLLQNNLNELKQSKINASFFVGKYRALFKKVLKHFDKYGKMPKIKTLRAVDPDFTPVREEALEPFQYYCEEFLNRAIFAEVRKTFEKGGPILAEDPHKVVNMLRKSLFRINSKYTPSTDIEIRENIDARKAAYEKAEAGLNLGVPFPWETLTEASMGMQEEDLISFVADSGVGKTWALLICAALAYQLGYHILFFTREMSADQIRTRFESVLGRFPYDALKRGQLGTQGKRDYYAFLDSLKDNDNVFYISGDDNYEEKIGLDLIEAKIDAYRAQLPDPQNLLVFVDGAYFLSADEAEDGLGLDWKVLAKVTQGLKRIGRKKKTRMVISSQAKRGTKKKDTPDQSDVGYGYSIVQDSNILIVMNQTDEDRAAGMMRFWTAKMREAAPVMWTANWNFNTMDFSEFGRGHDIENSAYMGDKIERKKRYAEEGLIEVLIEGKGCGRYGGVTRSRCYSTRARRDMITVEVA